MSVAAAVPAEVTAPRHRWRVRWLVAMVAAVVVVAAGGLWVRWLYSDHALARGSVLTMSVVHPVGGTLYTAPMVLPASRKPVELDLRSIVPRIEVNTAGATVRVVVCRRNHLANGLVFHPVFVCTSISPFKAGPLVVSDGQPGLNEVLFAVTPEHPGLVLIDGAHVTYRQGIRHGSQDTGSVTELHATKPGP